MKNKNDLYRFIKIAGFISFIPIVMVSGPLAGYILGDFLNKKLKWPAWIILILISLGFISSIIETVRIIKLVTKLDK